MFSFKENGCMNFEGFYTSGRQSRPQCDVSCMINKEMFIEFAVPALEKEGAALVIEEKDLTAELLVEKVGGLVSDPFRISDMSRNIGKFGSSDTLDKIYDIVMGLKK
jgi:hypothetical protein